MSVLFARLERHARSDCAGGVLRVEERVDPHRAGDPAFGSRAAVAPLCRTKMAPVKLGSIPASSGALDSASPT